MKDRIEHYNSNISPAVSTIAWSLTSVSMLVPRDTSERQHPVPLRPFLPEIQDFIEFNHKGVMNEVEKYVELD